MMGINNGIERKKIVLPFLLLWLLASLWAVIRPPFQSPDEFSHLIKALSFPYEPLQSPDPLVEVAGEEFNPLLKFSSLHLIPFYPERKVVVKDLIAMREMTWESLPRMRSERTSAYSYPPLYYSLLYSISQPIIEAFEFPPYEASYMYRLVSAFFAAVCWGIFFVVLRSSSNFREHWWPTVCFVLGHPMIVYLSSTISPDSLLLPVGSLACLLFIRIHFGEKRLWPWYVLALITALFTKPSISILGISLLLIALAFLLSRQRRSESLLLLVTTAGSLLLAYASYYCGSHPEIFGTPSSSTPYEYFRDLVQVRLGAFHQHFWGVLGWLDYGLPKWGYWILLFLFGLNVFCAVLQKKKPTELLLVGTVIFAIHSGGIIAAEYVQFHKIGPIIQGRYFLPAFLGLSVFLFHAHRSLQVLFLSALFAAQVVLFHESVTRYYGEDWERFFAALPFQSIFLERLPVLPKPH
jgi:hypothetical protein